jgi:hypothetical protein
MSTIGHVSSEPKDSAPKERVLHTRVPEALEAEIKALADALRVPVSGLVRNILEDSVRAVHDTATGLDDTLKSVRRNVETFSKNRQADKEGLRRGWSEFQRLLEGTLKGHAGGPERGPEPARRARSEDHGPPFRDVFGWQSITLNVDAHCAGCGASLSTGQTAHFGLREPPGPRVLACDRCVPRGNREG